VVDRPTRSTYTRTVTDAALASARQCVARIRQQWSTFSGLRRRHLDGAGPGQPSAEKVVENILCELFTGVLDWSTEQVCL